MDVIIKIIQVILALSVLVLVHELGHFCFAKMFKIRVEKFYLFFDWGFSLFKWKPKNSETEYGIGWLPIGGYCKISGMVDESMDGDSLKNEPQPWEFRSKPAWQRLLVLAGGVIFNFLLAIIIYIILLLGWGETYIKNSDAAIYTSQLAREMGFRDGDRIISFDDYTPDDFGSLSADLLHEQAETATVLRNGDTVEISLGNDYIPKMLDYKQPIFGVAIPFVIAEIPEDPPNKGLLMPGDSLTAIDGKEMTYLQDVRKYLSEHRDTTVELSMIRDGAPVNIEAKVDTAGLIQVMTRMPKITTKDYDFLTAIPAGIKLTFSTIGSYIKELKLVFNPETEAYKEVGSVISIGSIFPEKWDWFRFWSISALLSIMLGVMNLLPIPGLDGGHILFTLYEMITRHKPSDKFLMRAQAVGMLLLIMIIFLAFWNDLRNFVF